MALQAHDFVAETKGRCFLCSNKTQIHPQFPSTELLSDSSPIYSLDCLSRYLKIDMKKVFTGNGPIPPHLVARVVMSRLKTELCDKCAVLSGKFSKLYSRMEKTEMEMTSCLTIIQENLERAVKPENNCKAHNTNDMNSKVEWMAKLEIVEALREDTLQKCYHKLGEVRPFTKLQRLTEPQVNTKKRKIKSSKIIKNTPNANQYFESNYEYDNEDIGGSPSFSNEDGNEYFDGLDHSAVLNDDDLAEPEIVKQEVIEGTPVSYEMEIDIKMEDQQQRITLQRTKDSQTKQQPLQKKCQTETSKKSNVKNKDLDQLAQAIPPPIIVESGVGIVEKPDFRKNPETSKFECNICSKEYTLGRNLRGHYKSAHLKVKYKCTVCKNDFAFKQVYDKHYMAIHMGVKFKCVRCSKTFTQKGHLTLHQKSAHLG